MKEAFEVVVIALAINYFLTACLIVQAFVANNRSRRAIGPSVKDPHVREDRDLMTRFDDLRSKKFAPQRRQILPTTSFNGKRDKK